MFFRKDNPANGAEIRCCLSRSQAGGKLPRGLPQPLLAPPSSQLKGPGAMTIENPLYLESEDRLFVSPEKIYPAAVSGVFRRIKWAILFVSLGLYYLLPFIRWNRGP